MKKEWTRISRAKWSEQEKGETFAILKASCPLFNTWVHTAHGH
jgi:hypothetical protein